MKSRQEFSSDEQYNSYLRVYFSGQAIAGLSCMEFNHDINYDKLSKIAVKIADSLIKTLTINDN